VCVHIFSRQQPERNLIRRTRLTMTTALMLIHLNRRWWRKIIMCWIYSRILSFLLKNMEWIDSILLVYNFFTNLITQQTTYQALSKVIRRKKRREKVSKFCQPHISILKIALIWLSQSVHWALYWRSNSFGL